MASAVLIMWLLSSCGKKSEEYGEPTTTETPSFGEPTFVLPQRLPSGGLVKPVPLAALGLDETGTVGAARESLEARLMRAGYDDLRYVATRDSGVAIICRVERIQSASERLVERWGVDWPVGSADLDERDGANDADSADMRERATATDGALHRLIMLVLARRLPSMSGAARTEWEFFGIFEAGDPYAMDTDHDSELLSDYHVGAYVYLFREGRIAPSTETVVDHLAGAGLWRPRELRRGEPVAERTEPTRGNRDSSERIDP